jgi:hypothetical protein
MSSEKVLVGLLLATWLLAGAGTVRGQVAGEARNAAGQPAGQVVVVGKSPSASRLIVDPARGAWSFEAGGRRAISDARVEVVLPRPVAVPQGTRFVKFRLFQHGGDWNAYLGYVEFRVPGQAAPTYADSFTAQTPREKYVRAENLAWRTATEGGLICPMARDVWAEIVYETRAADIRCVYQAVRSDDVIEVHTSADGKSWSLLARKSGEGGITPRFQDGDAVLLSDTEVISLGPARCTTASAKDKLGEVKQIALQRTLERGLRLSARWSLLETEPVVALDLSVSNGGSEAAYVSELRPAAGFHIDLGAPAEQCTVITNDYWFAPRAIVRLDQQAETTEWWSTAVVDRATERTAVLGIGEAANAGIT